MRGRTFEDDNRYSGLLATSRSDPPAGKLRPDLIRTFSILKVLSKAALTVLDSSNSDNGSGLFLRFCQRDASMSGRTDETNEVTRMTRKPAFRTLSTNSLRE